MKAGRGRTHDDVVWFPSSDWFIWSNKVIHGVSSDADRSCVMFVSPCSSGWRRRTTTWGAALSASWFSPSVTLTMPSSSTSIPTWRTARYDCHGNAHLLSPRYVTERQVCLKRRDRQDLGRESVASCVITDVKQRVLFGRFWSACRNTSSRSCCPAASCCGFNEPF